jgi:DNA-binding beta-propeller fold protein YncE
MKWATGMAVVMMAAGAAVAATPKYKVAQVVPGPDGGWDFIRVDQANHRAVMTRGTSVMTLDLATSKIAATGLAPGQRLHDALPVNGGKELLVSYGDDNKAVFVDGQTGAPIATVKTGKNPDAEELDPVTGLVLVMNHSGGDITLIDPKTRTAVGAIVVGGDLEVAAADGKGRAFVNVENKNETVLVDLKARKVVKHMPLPGCDGPTGVAYQARRHWVLASCDGGTTIIDSETGKLVASLKTGKEADGIALDDKRDTAFVAGREGSLSVIALSPKPHVAQVLKTAVNNRTLAVDEATGRVYVPAADLAAKAPGERPSPVAGTFRVQVIGP